MSLRSRACIACYGIGAMFTVLSGRLVYVAVSQHSHYADIARKNYRGKVVLPARRGTIRDTNGTVLARNEPLRNVILDGYLITSAAKAKGRDRKPADEVAKILAGPLEMTVEEILQRISPEKKHVVLKKKISEDVAGNLEQALQAAGAKGVTFERDFERRYPAKELLSHVVGFYGFETTNSTTGEGRFKGVEGIERSMNSWLEGQEGWRYFEKDGHGRELVIHGGEERAPRNGANVRLTVDLNLQQIVESELAAACSRLRPLKASVVMMKPDTGEILALANRPTFDPNEPARDSGRHPRNPEKAARAVSEARFNNATAGIFEPGSTFKAITCAGAINSRLVTPNTEIWCENGKWNYGGKPLHDHHPYGMLSVSQIIEKSSNVGAAKLAVQLGEERFHNYVRAFGFGQATGIALPGEVRGIVHPRNQWSNISITRVAIGHEVGATPLQVTAATCAIANGGRLMMPMLIRDITDDSGAVLAKYEPQEVRRVITEVTAGKVRDALIKVTGKKGTASRAHIPGYQVAGKTGTAQKLEDGRYSHDHHFTSFIGFVPADKPAFCMLVIFDQAQVKASEDAGGLVAAPVFRAIAEKALDYLGVKPDDALLKKEKEQQLLLAKGGRD